MRKLRITLAILGTLAIAGTLYYFMPRANKVRVTGIDVKRSDEKAGTSGEHKIRDVRFIYATDADTNEALAFRNEDNPWYFKFDSGDLAAEASQLASNNLGPGCLHR